MVIKMKRLRMGLIITLVLLALVVTVGPILHIITAKPVNTEGPTVGPRTHFRYV